MCIDCNERDIDRDERDGSTGGSALKRRSFLQTTAVVGAGTVLGSQVTPAQASHVECDGADQFVASPNYSSRENNIDWIVGQESAVACRATVGRVCGASRRSPVTTDTMHLPLRTP